MAFVMVLSYSRQIFLRFFADARMENFLRGIARFIGYCWRRIRRDPVSIVVDRRIDRR